MNSNVCVHGSLKRQCQLCDQIAEIEELRQQLAEAREDADDARRYRFLKQRLNCADFMYGEEEIPVLIFDWEYAISGDLDASIDQAMRDGE